MISIEDIKFKKAFSTSDLKKLKAVVLEAGIKDEIKKSATHAYLASKNNRIVGGCFVKKTDTLIAILWIGNVSGKQDKFEFKLIQHIADNLANNKGFERVVGIFTEDLGNHPVSCCNVVFEEREKAVAGRAAPAALLFSF